MRNLVFRTALTTAVVGAVLAFGATSQAAPKGKQVAALDTTNQEVRRSGFSGNEIKLTYFYTVNSDCTSGPLVDVRVVKPPTHGEMKFEEVRSRVEYPKDHFRAHCNGKLVDAVGVRYTSNDDYTGSEKVQIEVDYKTGFVRRYSLTIDVR
jgi:hypothetical protein